MTYQDILKRLKEASEADRELDFEIEAVALGKHGNLVAYWTRQQKEELCNKYTASLDAAIALVERMLPGQGFFVGKGQERPNEPLGGAMIFHSISADSGDAGQGEAPTLPLALLIALFEALIASQPTPNPACDDIEEGS